MNEYGVVGIGPHAGAVVQSIAGLGFDNVMLVGTKDIEVIDLPPDRKVVFEGETPKTMQDAEQWATFNGQRLFAKMEELLGLPDRIFVVLAGDGNWAGASLVVVECSLYLLKKAGHTSNQRIGVFVATPPAVELQSSQQAKDLKFLINHLVEANVVRRQIDPLLIGDRTNICAILDSIGSPVQEAEDVIEQKEPEQVAPTVPPQVQQVVRKIDDLYGE